MGRLMATLNLRSEAHAMLDKDFWRLTTGFDTERLKHGGILKATEGYLMTPRTTLFN